MNAATSVIPVSPSLVHRYRLLEWFARGDAGGRRARDHLRRAGRARPAQRVGGDVSPGPGFLLVVGIVLTPAVLPTYLGHGITRRTVILAASAATGALVGFTATCRPVGCSWSGRYSTRSTARTNWPDRTCSPRLGRRTWCSWSFC
jgi:hypothetical protein